MARYRKLIHRGSRQLACALAGSCMTLIPAFAVPMAQSPLSQAVQQKSVQPTFAQHFQDLGVEGSIMIYDLKQNQVYQHNPERNAIPFLPASTFKILNSLIALEAGVIDDELSILTWDGVERSIPEWNRDLNMQTAIQISAVWFYQVLARRIGHEEMQQWIAKVGYGNQTIGSADNIDTFWLTGDLRITPRQQIEFLRRLYRNELPFSEDAIATVKNILIVEQTPDYTIRAKTGWALAAQVGWYVGYVEQNNNVYFFATNLQLSDSADLDARKEVTRRSLKSLQLL